MPLLNGHAIGTVLMVAVLTAVAIAFTVVSLRGMVIRGCYGRIHNRYLGV